MSGYFLENSEGADPFVVEFLHGSFGDDVSCVEPGEVVDFE